MHPVEKRSGRFPTRLRAARKEPKVLVYRIVTRTDLLHGATRCNNSRTGA